MESEIASLRSEPEPPHTMLQSPCTQCAEHHSSLLHRARRRSELDRLRVAALSGVGQQEELRRLAAEKAAKEKEKRVEHLAQMAAKRLGKKELARGWEAWRDAWEEKGRHRRMLQAWMHAHTQCIASTRPCLCPCPCPYLCPCPCPST